MNLWKLLFVFIVVVAFWVQAEEGQEKSVEVASVKYEPPVCSDCVFYETFENNWESNWIQSQNQKYDGRVELAVRENDGISNDHALRLPTSHRFYGISSRLGSPVALDKQFVFQYEVAFQDKLECGGAYMKLLTDTSSFSPETLHDQSPFSIMFGPDKCGATNKVHLIYRHTNKRTGKVEEKHLKNPPGIQNDRLSHLYTLIVNGNTGNSDANTYEILVDGESKKKGSFFEDFTPAFQEPEMIDDKDDVKPSNWVDEAKIPDPQAVKPDDWDENEPQMIDDEEAVKPSGWLDDEPEMISDPSSVKPSDWETEEDGDFEAPLIQNPKCVKAPGCGPWKRPTKRNPNYKGRWTAPLIDNPEYKGEWKPRQIPNPEYYQEVNPAAFSPIGAVAIEVWTTSKNILFDNIIVSKSASAASSIADSTWKVRFEVEKTKQENSAEFGNDSFVSKALRMVEEKPWIAVITGIAVLLPLIYFCTKSGTREEIDYSAPATASETKSVPKKEEKKEEKREEKKEEKKEEEKKQSDDETEKKEEKKPVQTSSSSSKTTKKRKD